MDIKYSRLMFHIALLQCFNRFCNSIHISRLKQISLLYQITTTTNPGSNYRKSTCHCLHHRNGKTFSKRREQEHVSHLIEIGDIRSIPGENHSVTHTQTLCQFFMCLHQGTTSTDHIVGVLVSQFSKSLNANFVVLVLINLTNRKHHFGIQRNTQFLTNSLSLVYSLQGEISYPPRKFLTFHLPHYSNRIV